MQNSRHNSLVRHPLLSFFVLAFALSWLIEIPLALQARGILNAHLPFGLHYLTGFGPLIAAVAAVYGTSGRSGLKQILLVVWVRTRWQAYPESGGHNANKPAPFKPQRY